MSGRDVGDERVAKIRQPAHQSEGMRGARLLGPDTYFRLGHRGRDQERRRYGIARFGGRISEIVPTFVLKIVKRSERCESAAKGRIRGYVLDAVAIDEDRAPIAQTSDVLVAVANSHVRCGARR